MESIAKGINAELMSITDKIHRIETTLDEWERSRKPMIFIEEDMALLSSMDSDADFMERRAEELKKTKEVLDEVSSLRNQ
tara:strand:- start:474 stop:713 length:240 start_codon:yes stop_codon:yes gene_type:complete